MEPESSLPYSQASGNLKISYFCGILFKFTRRANPIRITGDAVNQLPDKWVPLYSDKNVRKDGVWQHTNQPFPAAQNIFYYNRSD